MSQWGSRVYIFSIQYPAWPLLVFWLPDLCLQIQDILQNPELLSLLMSNNAIYGFDMMEVIISIHSLVL